MADVLIALVVNVAGSTIDTIIGTYIAKKLF